MFSILDELQKHYDLVIYLIIVIIFAIFLIVYLLVSNKKKKHFNRLENLKNTYKYIDELPIISSISKIEALANRNNSFSSMAAIYVQRYLEYGKKYAQPITEMFTVINAMINDTKYDIAREKISELEVLISSYKKDAESLLNEIKDATRDEEPLLNELDRVRKAYEEQVRKYQDNISNLSLVQENIKSRLTRIKNMISECDENIHSGIYIESKEAISKIDTEIIELEEYLKKMPQLISFAKSIIKKFNELIVKNNTMQVDYQIHHLKPFAKIERLKNDIERSIEKLKVLDYDGVEPFLREINNSIDDLNDALDYEKECKKEYDTKCENLYYISDCTVRNFDRIKKEIETVLQEFATTDEITKFLKKCDEYKTQLKNDKQIMDNNIYGHQPYSIRLENMNKLNNTIEEFQAHLDTFSNVAKRLEAEKNECIGKINGYINYLRQSQIILDNCNIPALNKKYREKINNIEELISKLFVALKKPYKVQVAVEICRTLDVECKDLYGKVNYSRKLMNYTEKIIVIASRYRDKFQEVDYAVNRASFYFIDGDFESCRNIIEKLTTYGISFPKFADVEA